MNKFFKKIGWYPVTNFGWIVTVFYTALLGYIVSKINVDLYGANFNFFALFLLSTFFIVLVLFYARLARKKPFLKRN